MIPGSSPLSNGISGNKLPVSSAPPGPRPTIGPSAGSASFSGTSRAAQSAIVERPNSSAPSRSSPSWSSSPPNSEKTFSSSRPFDGQRAVFFILQFERIRRFPEIGHAIAEGDLAAGAYIACADTLKIDGIQDIQFDLAQFDRAFLNLEHFRGAYTGKQYGDCNCITCAHGGAPPLSVWAQTLFGETARRNRTFGRASDLGAIGQRLCGLVAFHR